MSESELGYMQDDFDLPRWQTHNEPYNPYAHQQAQAQQQQQQQTQSTATLNPARIAQGSSAYSSDLTRSVSLGGPRTSNRRHHQPEDLEGAFSAQSQSLYTPALSYNAHSTPTSPDLFFTSAPPPKRSQQGGSPMRTTPQASQNSMLDPYTYPSSYDQRQPAYVSQTHGRSLSQQATQIKSEGLSPSPQTFGTGSTPSTPMTYMNPSQFYPEPPAPPEPPKQKRRPPGLQRVRDVRELTPRVSQRAPGRRMDSNGVYLSPLRQLTTNIVDTYHICNPQFRYESTLNPRRVLTKPSKPAHNEGYDNEDYDYILYVNDWLGAEKGHKFVWRLLFGVPLL
jgi:dual specificity protein kinase YAK1